MKKIAIAALAAVMALGLTACGGKNKDSADKTADSASAETGAPSGDTPGIVVIDPNEGKTAVNDTSSAAGHDPDKDEQTVIETPMLLIHLLRLKRRRNQNLYSP